LNIIIEYIIIIIIISLPSYLLSHIIFNNHELIVTDRLLLSVAIGFILIIFNMLVLTGNYAIPYILKILNIKYNFSLRYFFILLFVEFLLIFFIFYNKKKYINMITYSKITSNYKKDILCLIFIIIGISIIFIPHLYYEIKNDQPASSIVWGYHHLTLLFINNNEFPKDMYLYGDYIEFDTEYIGYNLFSGALYLTLNIPDNIFLKSMSIFSIIFSSIFAISFFNQLIRFPYCLITVIILFYMRLFIYKFSAYRTESLAILFMFISLWIIYKAINNQNYKLLIIGSLITSMISIINASIILVFISIIISLVIIKLIFENKKYIYIKYTLNLFILILIISSFLFYLSVGNIPIINTLIEKNKYDIINFEDPTWNFIRTMFPYYPDKPLFPHYLPNYFYNDLINNNLIIIFIFIVSGIQAIYKKSTRNIIMFLYIFTIFITIISIFFYKRYDTYVPARSGFQRIFPYIYIPLSFMPVIIIYNFNNIIFNIKINKYNIKLSYKLFILLLIFIIVYQYNFRFIKLNHNPSITNNGYKALLWFQKNTDPETTVIITNEWTGGSSFGISRRNILNDGDSPYLRPEKLPDVINLIENVRKFYKDPLEYKNLLLNYNVTHVLVSYNNALNGIKLLSDVEIAEHEFTEINLNLIINYKNIKIYKINSTSLNSRNDNK